MVDVNELKGAIVSRKKKQKDVYSQIGLTKRQWQIRTEKKVFSSDEIYGIVMCLGITDPEEIQKIFFAPNNN